MTNNGLLQEALRNAGLSDEQLEMVETNPMLAEAVASVVIRICDTLKIAAEASPRGRLYTGNIYPLSISEGVATLARKGKRLSISALACQLGTIRQNLNRAIHNDATLHAAYHNAVAKAQREQIKRKGRR